MLGWELPPHNSGGLGVACYHLSKALAANGADIEFVLPYSAEHPNTDFMKILPISKSRTPLEKFGSYDSVSGGLREVQAEYVDFVTNHVKDNPPDVIHAHDWLTMEAGMAAKKASGAPLIAHVHATEFDRAGAKPGNSIIHEIEYQGLMMADQIIAVSQITKALIIQLYGIPADKIQVAYNAFDPSEFDGSQYDRRTYKYLETLKQEGVTVVGTLGRFTVQKGLVQLMRGFAHAVHKYPKMVLLLVGDGDQRNELVELAAELGISDSVYYTGFIRGQVWRDAYSVMDIFVLSSISEPFGLVALEAAHHDSALVLTKQSGVSEVIASALRYDFWDTDRLADQLVGIAASKALETQLKEGARNEYTRLSWHDVAKQCMDLYARALNQPRSILA